MGKCEILKISIQYNAFCPLSEVCSEGITSDINSFASITNLYGKPAKFVLFRMIKGSLFHYIKQQ
jgi:subtilase family serine protease